MTHPPVTVCSNHQLLKCVHHTQRALEQIPGALTSATASKTDLNKCLLAQYESQLGEVNCPSYLGMLLLLNQRTKTCPNWKMEVCKFHFDLSLKLCCSLHSGDKGSISLSDKTGVKLPRLEVPSFDKNFVNGQSFWEQYHISVHDRTQLSDLEKLAYLKML